jgi:hypothetical protein
MAPEAFVGNQGTRKGDQGLKLVLSLHTHSPRTHKHTHSPHTHTHTHTHTGPPKRHLVLGVHSISNGVRSPPVPQLQKHNTEDAGHHRRH